MPVVPSGNTPVPTGTSLGVNTMNGTATSQTGLYSLIGGQRVLYDARQYHVGYHNPHTDIPYHNVSAPNEAGYVTSWPTIVPFNQGWFSLQAVYVSGEDAHYSPIIDTYWLATAIDLNGNILWQKRMEASDLHSPQTQPPSWMSDVGTYSDVIATAGNRTGRVLIEVQDFIPDGLGAAFNSYYHFDFDSSGNWTDAPAFTMEWGTVSTTYMTRNQIPSGSGVIAFSNRYLQPGRKILCLSADLDLVGTITIPTNIAPYMYRSIVGSWNGQPGPHILEQSGAANVHGTRAWKINFDGVSAPTLGSPVESNSAGDIWNSSTSMRTNGNFIINNWDTGAEIPKAADYWCPSDGSALLQAPNPLNLEWVYQNSSNDDSAGGVAFVLTNVADWYDHQTNDSYYSGDNYGSTYMNLRVNIGDFNGNAGVVDFLVKYPKAPTFSWTDGIHPNFGQGNVDAYWDSDLDEPGLAIPNGWNDRILIWTYNYWTSDGGPPYTQTGWDFGGNRLTSYWVFSAGGATPPPTVPGWVDVFGSTSGGTSDSGNGPCIDCGMLGSGNNRAFLYDRGGTRKIAEITDITMLRWNRVRDDISDATIIVNSPRPECCAILANIAVGRHEIVIFRDQDRVWEGPITRINWKASSVEITAADVCHYLSRTIMHNAYDNRWKKTGSKVGPVTHRAQAIIANELKRKEALDAPVNILRFLDVRTHPNTTRTSRFTYPYQSTVWEEIDYMAQRLSLDYTTIGRRIVIFDTHDVLSRLQMLTDKDFTDELIVSSYGMELATLSAVTDGEGHWAAVGGIDPFYGEVELLNTTYGEGVQPANPTAPTKAELAALAAEMTSQAQRNLSGRYPIPTVVRVPDGTQLQPSAPVCINELVPGVRVPIRSSLACLTMQQEQKLDKVAVEQTENGESVSITLSPAPGTTPWDDSSETSPGDDGEDA